jgi:actin-related protein
VLLDNGAHTLKCSLASDAKPHITLNAVGKHKKTQKTFLGNKLRDEFDKGFEHAINATNPIVRGLLHDTDALGALWKAEFAKVGGKKFEESESCLCITVPPIMPDLVQNRLAELVFEDF